MEPDNTEDPVSQPSASARGWHRIQLAVLGFVGLCGVLWAGTEPAGPDWLQWLAGAMVALALVLACLAIYLVGRVAYPVSDAPPPAGGAQRLRAGIRITYLAVAVLAVGTLSGWWPGAAEADPVQVRDASGRAWCGELVESRAGTVRLDTAEGPVTVPMNRVAGIDPAGSC